MTKPTKWPVRPAKTQISLGIRPVWSESSLCAQWVAKDPSFFMRPAKTLISLSGCPGWFESWLGAHVILLVLLWLNYDPTWEMESAWWSYKSWCWEIMNYTRITVNHQWMPFLYSTGDALYTAFGSLMHFCLQFCRQKWTDLEGLPNTKDTFVDRNPSPVAHFPVRLRIVSPTFLFDLKRFSLRHFTDFLIFAPESCRHISSSPPVLFIHC